MESRTKDPHLRHERRRQAKRRLTHGEVHFSVAWSPDGQKMLFERGNPRHWRGPIPGEFPEELYVMNADGSGQRRLTRNPASVT